MAITRTAVGTAISDTGSTVASLVYTLGGSVPQGATIAIGSYHSANNSGAGTMVDSSGNAYTQNGGPTALNASGTNGYLATWYADNVLALVAGDTITFTPPASAAKIDLVVDYLSGPSVPSLIVSIAGTGSSTSPASGTPTVNATNALPAGAISLTFVGFRNASAITETFTAGGSATAGQSVQGNASSVTSGIFEEYNSVNGSPPNGTGTLGHTDTWAAITLHFRPACTWFYDYESGSDFNGGDSFAVTATNTNGVGNGTTTFTSAGMSFDSTYLGRFINVSLVGANTQGLYLIVGVNSATSLTLNATVATNTGYTYNVGGAFKTPKFGGNIGQNSQTTQSSGSGFKGTAFQAGDTARLKASTDAQDVGTTALFTSNTNASSPTASSLKLTLTAAQNLTVTTGNSAWTASANVTCTADASIYVGGSNTHSAKQAIAAGFGTGLAAFFATGSLTINSYQQMCFWIYTSVAITAGQYSLRLCSDTAGVTTVETVAIPAIPTISTWTPVVVNKGSAYSGTTIQSVALYRDSGSGAVNIYLCGLFLALAPGASALTLNSVVGKNTTPEPYWWPIRTIEGTAVYLDTGNPSVSNNQSSQRGYYGVTETVELYKREPIAFTVSSSSGNTFTFASNTSGVSGQSVNAGIVPYTVSGGWDRTNMSSQSGQTWITFSDGSQNGFSLNAAYQKIDLCAAVRASTGFTWNLTAQGAMGFCQAAACTIAALLDGTAGNTCTTFYAIGNSTGSSSGNSNMNDSWIGTWVGHSNGSGGGLSLSNGQGLLIINTLTCCNNGTTGITFGSSWGGDVLVTNCGDVKYNNGQGITATDGSNVVIQGNPNFAGQQTGSLNASLVSRIDIQNLTSTDTTVTTVGIGSCITVTRYGGVSTDHRQYYDFGNVVTDTSTRHTAAGASWKLSPTDRVNCGANRPLRVKVASVALKASEARTLSCWVRRNAGGITSQLCIPGGQAAGLSASDAVASSTQINAWEQLSLTITPTVDCVVDVYGQAYGGTTLAAWFQDVAVA